MAEARGLDVVQLFKIFDKNKSADIDYEQFFTFIKYIAPAIKDREINIMWIRFDKDHSNRISLK